MIFIGVLQCLALLSVSILVHSHGYNSEKNDRILIGIYHLEHFEKYKEIQLQKMIKNKINKPKHKQ